MKLPSNVLNPLLYRYAYDKVTRIYGTQTSAYRSMAIVKAYKQLGGKYAGTQRGGGGATTLVARTMDHGASVRSRTEGRPLRKPRSTQTRVSSSCSCYPKNPDDCEGGTRQAREGQDGSSGAHQTHARVREHTHRLERREV